MKQRNGAPPRRRRAVFSWAARSHRRVQAHRAPRDIDIAIASLSAAGDAFILNP
ncbi:hypothetical protein [Burkholderia ambifaria]|uniref:hypothetical protein n=1 Tax=Burkholderia ambifaria TaxID=152480 RepID=UPI001588E72B|nr:hypothetical protein [Burkholderia ambifaria]MBR8344293.1 hypothetical protein [Burkholderia ambifaria]